MSNSYTQEPFEPAPWMYPLTYHLQYKMPSDYCHIRFIPLKMELWNQYSLITSAFPTLTIHYLYCINVYFVSGYPSYFWLISQILMNLMKFIQSLNWPSSDISLTLLSLSLPCLYCVMIYFVSCYSSFFLLISRIPLNLTVSMQQITWPSSYAGSALLPLPSP